jgi:hypothetical protein
MNNHEWNNYKWDYDIKVLNKPCYINHPTRQNQKSINTNNNINGVKE